MCSWEMENCGGKREEEEEEEKKIYIYIHIEIGGKDHWFSRNSMSE